MQGSFYNEFTTRLPNLESALVDYSREVQHFNILIGGAECIDPGALEQYKLYLYELRAGIREALYQFFDAALQKYSEEFGAVPKYSKKIGAMHAAMVSTGSCSFDNIMEYIHRNDSAAHRVVTYIMLRYLSLFTEGGGLFMPPLDNIVYMRLPDDIRTAVDETFARTNAFLMQKAYNIGDYGKFLHFALESLKHAPKS